MKYLSLFSGIGGFELGIQRAFSCDREQHIESISDSSRYKMCGNAVTVNVVEAVVAQLFAARAEGHHPTNTN